MKFRKKPVVIEAMQLKRESCPKVCEWADLPHSPNLTDRCGELPIYINTLEGEMRADPGDWVIRGVNGEFYPCKPDIFEETYEPADSPPQGEAIDAAQEAEGEVARQRRIMAGCAAVIDTLPAGDDEDLAISLDRLSSRLRGFPNAE